MQPLRDVLVKQLLFFTVSSQNPGKNVYKKAQFQFSASTPAILPNINFLICIPCGSLPQTFGQLFQKNQLIDYFPTEKTKINQLEKSILFQFFWLNFQHHYQFINAAIFNELFHNKLFHNKHPLKKTELIIIRVELASGNFNMDAYLLLIVTCSNIP